MITGFRMEATQDVDEMWEADTARLWEELNEEPEDEYPHWQTAIAKLEQACAMLSSGEDAMHSAAEYISGSPEDDRIESLATSCAELYDEIQAQIRRMREVG